MLSKISYRLRGEVRLCAESGARSPIAPRPVIEFFVPIGPDRYDTRDSRAAARRSFAVLSLRRSSADTAAGILIESDTVSAPD